MVTLRAVGKDTSHAGQNFFVKIPLVGRRGHLNENDGRARLAQSLVKVGVVVAQKLLNDVRLAHAGSAVDDQAWHAVAGWVIDQIHQALENALGARILNPSLLPNPGDTFFIAQRSHGSRRSL